MRRRFLMNNDTTVNSENYLTLEALEDGLTASLASDAVEYCVDSDGNWKTISAGTYTEAINKGQKLLFRANYTTYNQSRRFTISKKCNVMGDPMSLYVGDNAAKTSVYKYNYTFAYLFNNCTTIIDASGLKLERTPRNYTCDRMFQGCTNLVNAPILPYANLVIGCYRRMFYGCSNLNYIKMLATNISASSCLDNWVYGVAASGTFVKNPNATWEVYGNNGIPTGWKVIMDGEEEGSDSEGYNFSFGLVQTEPGETIEEYGDYSEVFDVMVNLAREIGYTSKWSITVDAVPEEYFISIDGSEEYRIDYYDVTLDSSGNPVDVTFYCEYDVFFAMGFFDARYIYFMGAS